MQQETFKKMFGRVETKPIVEGDANDLSYLQRGPNVELIRENLLQYVGPQIDEDEYAPRTDGQEFLGRNPTASEELAALMRKMTQTSQPVRLAPTTNPKLSERARTLRKRNALLNRLMGPLVDETVTGEQNDYENDSFPNRYDNNNGYQFRLDGGSNSGMHSNDSYKRKHGGKPKPGQAIVDMNAVARVLKQQGFAERGNPHSSSSSSSGSNSALQFKKRMVDDGRDGYTFQMPSDVIRAKPIDTSSWKPLDQCEPVLRPPKNGYYYSGDNFPPL